MHNKKALADPTEIIEKEIINLLLIGIILLTFLAIHSKIQDNTVHTERAKARDLAFTYDAASLAQGSLYLAYDLPKNFEASNTQLCKTSVMEQTKDIPSSYLCNEYREDTNLIQKDSYYSIQKNV